MNEDLEALKYLKNNFQNECLFEKKNYFFFFIFIHFFFFFYSKRFKIIKGNNRK